MNATPRARGCDRACTAWFVAPGGTPEKAGPSDIYKALLGRSDHDWDREYTERVSKALIDAVRSAREKLA
jgi:hypothetical protein